MKRTSAPKNWRKTGAKPAQPTPRRRSNGAPLRQLGETPKGGAFPTGEEARPLPMPLGAAPLPGSLPAMAGPLPESSAACGMHPADELAAVREEIKALKAREAELRDLVLSDPTSRLGTWNAACVETGWQARIDGNLLRQNYPDIAVAVTKRMQVVFVRTVQVRT